MSCATRLSGPDTLPPPLLVMGLASQMVLWDDEFCQAMANRRLWVIRFDNRDIGRSTILRGWPVPTRGQLRIARRCCAA